MPYIKKNERESLTPKAHETPNSPGGLNFQFTELVKQYMDIKGLSYQTINDVVGALEGAKLEFYRRVAVPYENQKIHDNGDVYNNERA